MSKIDKLAALRGLENMLREIEAPIPRAKRVEMEKLTGAALSKDDASSFYLAAGLGGELMGAGAAVALVERLIPDARMTFESHMSLDGRRWSARIESRLMDAGAQSDFCPSQGVAAAVALVRMLQRAGRKGSE